LIDASGNLRGIRKRPRDRASFVQDDREQIAGIHRAGERK